MILPAVAIMGCNKRYLDVDDVAPVADDVDAAPEAVDDDPVDTKVDTEAETADLSNVFDTGAAGTDTAEVEDNVIDIADIGDYTIVYYNSAYAKLCAEEIRDAIKDATGEELAITTDAAEETEKEILVGKTNRAESVAVRDTYDRHNIRYDVKVDGAKLVVMAEGYLTLQYVADAFAEYVADAEEFKGDVLDGNVSAAVDTIGTSMLERQEGTNLRVFHWNMAAPMALGGIYDITSNINRGEIIADIIIQLDPDIVTTNEIYYGHQGNRLYNTVVTELADHYSILDTDYYKDADAAAKSSDSGYEVNYPVEGADAVVGAYTSGEVSIPENIIYKNNIGLTVKYSGWRYLNETDEDYKKGSNELGFVYYHGYHTAVFETADEKDFIVSVGHYGRETGSTDFTEGHIAAITYAAEKAGVTLAETATVVTGDMFTYKNKGNGAAGYDYWVSQGYSDSQTTAAINANSPEGCLNNDNKLHGTFHDPGVRKITNVSEDFIWYKNGLSALCFKVLVSMDIDDCSDHYPVMADLKFAE